MLSWIVGPALPYVAGGVAVALALGAWTINDRAFDRGVTRERVAWETEASRLRAVAAVEAQERAAAIERANGASAASRVALDALAAKTRKDANAYYQTNPGRNVVCLSPERLRAISESDTAAYAAASAPN